LIRKKGVPDSSAKKQYNLDLALEENKLMIFPHAENVGIDKEPL